MSKLPKKHRILSNMKKINLFFILILSAILIFIGAVNLFFYSKFKTQTYSVNKYIRNYVIDSVYKYHQNLNSVVVTLSRDIDSEIFTLKERSDFFSSKKVHELIEKLQDFEDNPQIANSVYLYVRDSDLIISANGIYNSWYYYDIYLKNDESSYETWIELLKSDQRGDYSYVKTEDVHYILSLNQFIAHTNDVGVVKCVIVQNKKSIFAEIPNAQWIDHYNVYLYDSKDRLSIYDGMLKIDGLSQSPEIKELLAKRDGYDIVVDEVSVGNFKYKLIFIFENKQIFYDLRMMGLIALIAFIVCSSLFVLFLYLMYIFVQKPMYLIADDLDVEKDKLSYMDLTLPIRKLINENEKLDTKQKTSYIEFRNMLLEKLLIGDYEKKQDSLFDKYGLQFDFKNFIVVITSISTDLEEELQNDNGLLFYIEEFIAEAINDETSAAYNIFRDNEVITIICTEHSDEKIILNVAQKFAYVVKLLGYEFDFVAGVAVSDIHEGYENVYKGYIEALNTLDTIDMTYPNIVLYSNIEKNNKTFFTLEDESKFSDVLKRGDFDEANRIIRLVIDTNHIFNNRNLYLGSFILSLIKIAESMNVKYDYDEYVRLFYRETEPEYIQKKCSELAKKICDLTTLNKQTSYEKLAQKIKMFIDENYENPNLSLNMISDELRYSTVHVNNVFKKMYNIQPINYLNEYRVRKATQYIAEGKKIKDIVSMIGFTNVRTFNRVFSKVYGQSPSQYRSNLTDANLD